MPAFVILIFAAGYFHRDSGMIKSTIEQINKPEHVQANSRYFICKIVKGVRKISSYAFKMRQDYLSTRYLDQFISYAEQ